MSTRIAHLECDGLPAVAGLPPLSTPGRALPYQDPQGVGASAPTKNCGAQRLPFAAQFPRAVAFAALRRSPASVESGSRPAAGLPPLSTPGRALPYQDPQGVGASVHPERSEGLRQKTAARSAFLSRRSSRELSLSPLSNVREPARAFVAIRRQHTHRCLENRNPKLFVREDGR